MSLITLTYIKQYFPLWNKYFLDTNGDPDEAVLTNELALAEAELSEYISVTETTITDSEKMHLLNIVKKRGWDRRHGDSEFKVKAQIIKDYEATIEKLKNKGSVSITAKDRIFDQWFNDPFESLNE